MVQPRKARRTAREGSPVFGSHRGFFAIVSRLIAPRLAGLWLQGSRAGLIVFSVGVRRLALTQ